MVVYRVQNKEGYGPYVNATHPNCEQVLQRHGADYCKWPIPDMDGLDIRENRFCCFVSLRQLHNWFSTDDLDLLSEAGYEIELFEADVCGVSDKQALYVRRTETELRPVPND